MTDLARQHEQTAATFTRLVDAVTDWDVPTPVREWSAADIVGHLTSWLPGLLGASGVELPPGPSASVDPARAWRHQSESVQLLLESPRRAEQEVAFPGGTRTAAQVIAEFYEPDVFMHAWDLARATGQPFELEASRCQEMVDGMTEAEEMIRASGQFGERVEVPADASPQDRLIGFIGRDPGWRPPTG